MNCRHRDGLDCHAGYCGNGTRPQGGLANGHVQDGLVEPARGRMEAGHLPRAVLLHQRGGPARADNEISSVGYFRGAEYNAVKKTHRGSRSGRKPKGQNVPLPTAAENLATKDGLKLRSMNLRA
jgi:hypothetical protein